MPHESKLELRGPPPFYATTSVFRGTDPTFQFGDSAVPSRRTAPRLVLPQVVLLPTPGQSSRPSVRVDVALTTSIARLDFFHRTVPSLVRI